MVVGALGEVQFSVSSWRVMTFDKYKRKSQHRYSTHEIIGNTPVLESLGNDLEELSLEIVLTKSAGVNPKEQADKLREMLRAGEANYLIVGADVIGSCKWVVTDLDEEITGWDYLAAPFTSRLKIKLKQYDERGDNLVINRNNGASQSGGGRFWSNVARSLIRAIFKI